MRWRLNGSPPCTIQFLANEWRSMWGVTMVVTPAFRAYWCNNATQRLYDNCFPVRVRNRLSLSVSFTTARMALAVRLLIGSTLVRLVLVVVPRRVICRLVRSISSYLSASVSLALAPVSTRSSRSARSRLPCLVSGSGWTRMAWIWVEVKDSLISSGTRSCLSLAAGLLSKCPSWAAQWKRACGVRVLLLVWR